MRSENVSDSEAVGLEHVEHLAVSRSRMRSNAGFDQRVEPLSPENRLS